MSAASSEFVIPRAPWDGGRRYVVAAGLAGLIGVALWFVSIGWSSTERAAFSWLWAFFFWLSPALGALGWLCSFHAAKAKWVILPRRTLEVLAAAAPIFLVLFIPVVLWMKGLYPWTHPESYDDEARKLFAHRAPWLNTGMWLVRSGLYFFVFIVVGELLLRWSTQQDDSDLPLNTAKSWRLGPGSLPFLGLAVSFAGFDWLMSLNVTMYSSMFGLYIVAGCAVAGMAAWILLTMWTNAPVGGDHMHSMGKLLFAFTCFWGYTAFCQFMLIWIADIPDETPWHHLRIWTDWRWVGYFLCVFHFAAPFVILWSKRLKFSRIKLSTMAVWLLVAHAVDIYWIVLPQLTGDGPHPSLGDLFAFVGVGGLATAFVVFRLRGRQLVAIGDPFLPNSLEYHP